MREHSLNCTVLFHVGAYGLQRNSLPARINKVPFPWPAANCLATFQALVHKQRKRRIVTASADSAGGIENLDSNQLQTALNQALSSEDYAQAASLRDKLRELQGELGASLDWRALGILEWLAERAEQMRFKFPTDVQRRCCQALQDGNRDVVVQSETGSGKTLAFLLPLLSLLDYPPDLFPDDLLGPQMIVLVPHMELGVQEAMLIYKLFGGSVNPGIPGSSANMFAYRGPRGLKSDAIEQVRGVLNEEEVLLASNIGYLKGVHVLVATPNSLAEILRFPEFKNLFADLKALAVDEVDACFADHPEAMQAIMTAACGQPGKEKPTVAFVGATLSESLAQQTSQMGWLLDPAMILPRAQGGARVPEGLQHRYIKVPAERKLAELCRQLRADLAKHGEDAPPPRVIVFTGSEEAAVAAADPLRTVLWGEHRLAVLLPHGEEPIKALHAFRDNAATFLLATPAAARGLDLPAVSHVYNMDCCADATEYLHRAGRAGRIGSPVAGVVTSLIAPEEEAELKSIAGDLGIDLLEEVTAEAAPPADPNKDIDQAKRELEDLFNLM